MGGRRAVKCKKWTYLCKNIFAKGRNLDYTNGWFEAVLTTTAQNIAFDTNFVEAYRLKNYASTQDRMPAYRLTSFASTHGAEMWTSLSSSVTFTPGCSRKNRINEAG